MNSTTTSSWIYCYKRGEKAVMFNRWGEDVKEFESYEDAVKFFDENPELIDKRFDNPLNKDNTTL